jgi:MFS family permease
MKRSFAIMSCFVIISPVISAYLALMVIPVSWRLTYLFMALIELGVMIYSIPILRNDSTKQKLILRTDILSGFKHALSKPSYVINMVTVAILFSFYLGVLMSSFKNLVVHQLNMSINMFSILFLAASLIYILGIISYRFRSHVSHKRRYTVGILVILFFAILCYSLTNINVMYIIPILYIICYFIGFLAPLATGVAMSNISHGHGSAAAMITFAVTFFMALWEYMKAHLKLHSYDFILISLWIMFSILVVMKILQMLYCRDKIVEED